MSHYNQNRNFATHYQGQQDPRNNNSKHGHQDDAAAVNRNLSSNLAASLSTGLSAIRLKCQKMLENSASNNNDSQQQQKSRAAAHMKMLSQGSVRSAALKAAVNHGKANILKAQPYRAGIGSESLTAQEREAQLQAENDKKQNDILRHTAVASSSADGGDENGSSGDQGKKLLATVTKNIDSITKDAGEQKILARVLPRSFMKGGNQNDVNGSAGQIRQREEDNATQPVVPPSSSAASTEKKPPPTQQAPPPSLVSKGGGTAVVGTKKLAVDPRMAMMSSLGKKKKK